MPDTSEAIASHLARAEAFEADERLADAAAAYDAALAIDADDCRALDGRVRVALELHDPGVIELCRRSLAYRDDDPELQLQMLASVSSALGAPTIPLLLEYLAHHPGAAEAHERLAELRTAEGEDAHAADSYLAALRERPRDRALHQSYWLTLSRAHRYAEAIAAIDAARETLGEDLALLLLEAGLAHNAGELDRAAAVIARLGDRPEALLPRGQHYLQTRRYAEAAPLLEQAARRNPHDMTPWALLAVAWRLAGDSRHEWLCGQPGLWNQWGLGLDAAELAALAERLRALHRTRAQPLGQSIRGGTQTTGWLLANRDPEIRRLGDALTDAVRRHRDALPPADRDHPLLRHRDARLVLGPSWSVRLTGGGFHVAHLHPAGVLSSACHVSLPQPMGEEKAGWLELGRPPAELGLDLEPLASIEPREGRLVLFPSYLFHGTRPFAAGERLSVAFDVFPR